MKYPALFLTIFVITGRALAGDLVISEIMFNPNGDENAREFVEIANIADVPVNLKGWIIGDGEDFDTITPVNADATTIPAGGFALVLDPDYLTSDEPYEGIPADVPLFVVDDKAIGSRGLSNSTAEPVSLVSASGDTVSVVFYDLACPAGHSWERVVPDGGDDPGNFAASLETDGTPGRVNSASPPSHAIILESGLVRFLPDTPVMGENLTVAVACRNGGTSPLGNLSITLTIVTGTLLDAVSLPGVIEPGTVSPEMQFGLDTCPGGRLAFEVKASAMGAEDTLTVFLDVPIAPGSILLNEIMAAPAGGDPEWIEIVNTSATPVNLYCTGIRDERADSPVFVSDHVFVPAGGYALIAADILPFALPENVPVAVVPGFPALNNDGDTVSVLGCTGNCLDSAAYGDTESGHSLELIGPGSGWDTCTDPSGATPGWENSIVYDSDDTSRSSRVTVEPNPFGDMTRISYELSFPLARVTLSVYDRRGRIVARLREGEESGAEWSCTWDGRSGGSRLPAGPYILLITALNKRTGNVFTEKKAIIIGTAL